MSLIACLPVPVQVRTGFLTISHSVPLYVLAVSDLLLPQVFGISYSSPKHPFFCEASLSPQRQCAKLFLWASLHVTSPLLH